MARRTRKKKSSTSNPLPAIIATIVGLVIVAGAYFILTREKSTSTTELNADTYITAPESMRGSTFTVKAEVIKKLYYEEGVTQVVQVNYNNEPISIVIPADVAGPNINTQQEYTFIVKAKNDAWLVAKSYTDK